MEGEARKVLLAWLAGRRRGRDEARNTECLNMTDRRKRGDIRDCRSKRESASGTAATI